ncbi:hypothetical protein E3H11_09485 [Bradyrhizobium brasilense]|uniref:hypothetical protein n=1 Tax=Bradyrhizobium brasilense TaxID=1419277 RepID=UPI00145732CE|nr:hypothetical protein [Bradyrhizobium brasilense]NLS69148.1 hypothetical protein [Bradyrhizobium brasilense]
MSEMAEHVAALFREQLNKLGFGVATINTDQLADELARTAIEAMREPTATMADAEHVADKGEESPSNTPAENLEHPCLGGSREGTDR